MRRPVPQDPFARSAVWSRNVAVFALAVAVIGIVASRKGLEARPALAIEGGALALAGLAIIFAVVAMAVIWVTGFRGVGLALAGLVLSASLLAYPGYLALEVRTGPELPDVSTDTVDPPGFLQTPATLAARHGATPPPTMAIGDVAGQKRAYPDLHTLDLPAKVGDVDELIHKVLKRRGWQIVDEVKPLDFATGHVDVVIKPALMGFRADLTVRLRGLGERTKVDIRSVSRTPWPERPGANAARVDALAADLEDGLDES